jgi:hypothetical protein
VPSINERQLAVSRKSGKVQLRMVLAGIDFWNAHEKLSYRSVV